MNDTVELDSNIGTKKRLKLEAKAEKRQQREVNKFNSIQLMFDFLLHI